MKRATFTSLGACVLSAMFVLASAGASSAAGAVSIRGIDVSGYPELRTTVAVQDFPAGSVPAFQVTENGQAVPNVSVTPIADTQVQVDVVLAIDTSTSMEGEPLAAALSAARSFVGSLPPAAFVGVVTFAGRAVVRQPLSADHAAALAALDGPVRTTNGTAMYDAVRSASLAFQREAQRNIILLSDGRDTASRADISEAIAAAKAAGAAVFSVGLQHASSDPAALTQLATETGGRFSPVATADLSAIYAGLASELSNQFVLSYRTSSAHGQQATVQVSAGGAADSALVLLPRATAPVASLEPAGAPASSSFLRGGLGEAAVLVFGFLAVFVVALMLFGARARSRRDEDLARRMAAKPDQAPDRPDRGGMAGWLPDPIIEAGARVASAGGFSGSLDAKLDRAGAPIKTGEFVAATVGAAALGAFLGLGLLGNLVFAVLFLFVGGSVPSVLLAVAVHRRTEKMHAQLADILMLLASSLRAGHSFLQALDMVAQEIGDPASGEFGRVVAEIRLGRPIEEALNAMAERIGSEDLTWAVLAINIQREVGGNLAEILDTLAEVVRDRNTIRRQVGVLSAEGRLSMWILAALPILIGLYMAKVNPDYIGLLFTTQVGLVMVVVASCLMVLGVLWMRKVVRIRV